MPTSHILLVEDDESLRDLIKRILQARGHEVRVAEDARSALDELRLHAFDLVVLDINLPDQSGWDILRIAQQEQWLRPRRDPQDDTLAKLPVVVLSAVRVSMARLREFRPLAYLPKPFPVDALLRLAETATLTSEPYVQDTPEPTDDLALSNEH